MFPYRYLESTSDKNEEAEENSTETSKPCEGERVIINQGETFTKFFKRVHGM